MTRYGERGSAVWRARRLSNSRTKHDVTLQNTIGERVFVAQHGTQFEDCLRMAVLVDGTHPDEQINHLLFDAAEDNRFSSSQLRERFRDMVLGFKD